MDSSNRKSVYGIGALATFLVYEEEEGGGIIWSSIVYIANFTYKGISYTSTLIQFYTKNSPSHPLK